MPPHASGGFVRMPGPNRTERKAIAKSAYTAATAMAGREAAAEERFHERHRADCEVEHIAESQRAVIDAAHGAVFGEPVHDREGEQQRAEELDEERSERGRRHACPRQQLLRSERADQTERGQSQRARGQKEFRIHSPERSSRD